MLAFIAFITSVPAQANKSAKVRKFKLQNLRPILESNVVKDYFVYLYEGKARVYLLNVPGGSSQFIIAK